MRVPMNRSGKRLASDDDTIAVGNRQGAARGEVPLAQPLAQPPKVQTGHDNPDDLTRLIPDRDRKRQPWLPGNSADRILADHEPSRCQHGLK